jgi:hypothetical protein
MITEQGLMQLPCHAEIKNLDEQIADPASLISKAWQEVRTPCMHDECTSTHGACLVGWLAPS